MNPSHVMAYAVDAVSFILQKLPVRDLQRIRQIVLFGSAARGEASADSDVDLFVETQSADRIEPRLREILTAFQASTKVRNYWALLGIRLPISLKVGELDDWELVPAALREHGRILFGAYRAAPATGKPLALVTWENVSDRAKRTNLYRNLVGYASQTGRRPGLIAQLGGRRVAKGAILIPLEHLTPIRDLFRRIGVTCRIETISEYAPVDRRPRARATHTNR